MSPSSRPASPHAPPGAPGASLEDDPSSVTLWDASRVHELLDRFFSTVPAERTHEVPWARGRRALVLGDTHTDWPTSLSLARQALGSEDMGYLFATGDYVDRAPPELPFGSVVNALFLLSLRTKEPERVVLLRGNHETQRDIPILLNEVVDEATSLWGPGEGVGGRVLDAFDRLPLAASTESGAYLAHAGFPRDRGSAGWKGRIAGGGIDMLEEVVWNDLQVSAYVGGRGLEIPPISEEETLAFLREAGFEVFLRGHDPTEAGRARYQNRVLTLHTSRVYEWAGLHVAELPLDRRVRDLRDVVHRTLRPPPLPAPPKRSPRPQGK